MLKNAHEHIPIAILSFLWAMIFTSPALSAPGRFERELTGPGWTLRLDEKAEWKNDKVILPPFELGNVPVNPPTGGWEELDRMTGKRVTAPGTVEEHFWGFNGNPVGIAGDFRGVSWWSVEFTLDPALRGKRILLDFESVNLRAEVFLNRKLVGYDVIGNTPFEVDATNAARFDSVNRLDIRITDPVGAEPGPGGARLRRTDRTGLSPCGGCRAHR